MESRSLERFEAVILDMDGVITQTADLHAEAWGRAFAPLLEERHQPPFNPEGDYLRHVDGKPRLEGVRSFLRSRGIELPEGEPQDPAGWQTVFALGRRKNEIFTGLLQEKGAHVFDDFRRKLADWRRDGLRLAVVSSSRNCAAVLDSAGLGGAFDVRVDGVVADSIGLQGKPSPDIFLEAARRLDVDPAKAAVIEDALAGVQAGRRGGFGLVVGIDRRNTNPELSAEGADLIIQSLDELDGGAPGSAPAGKDIPLLLEEWATLSRTFLGKRIALFLDYDGTLTPIVPTPEAAVLSDCVRTAVRHLTDLCLVAVISGRELTDVRQRVGLPELYYAGSHGFDIAGPGGLRLEHPAGQRAIPLLDQAQALLDERLRSVSGARLERKRFSLAVHFRLVSSPEEEELVRAAVGSVVSRLPGLRVGQGKKIFELRPDVDWGKGRAVAWLMDQLQVQTDGWLTVYVGDDVTDEEAFDELKAHGITVLVSDEPRPTAARWRLRDTEEVGRFLLLLQELARDGAGA